jgi:hypothetical protein
MPTNQEGRQISVRGQTSTTLDHASDWHALFTSAGIASGDWNSRFIQWANGRLSSSYTNINEAKRAFAASLGYTRWNDVDTIGAGGPGGSADAFLLEDGSSGFLLEDGTSYILLET